MYNLTFPILRRYLLVLTGRAVDLLRGYGGAAHNFFITRKVSLNSNGLSTLICRVNLSLLIVRVRDPKYVIASGLDSGGSGNFSAPNG